MLISRGIPSELYNSQNDLRGCWGARFIPVASATNVDMDGIAVGVASVVLTISLRILISWSPEDIDVGVQANLTQIYSILLSTLASVNQNQLSIFDANLALFLSSSPLTMYLVIVSCFSALRRLETDLYKRIKSHRRVICAFVILVPVIWFVLTTTITLSDRAFLDSEICHGSTFKDWALEFSLFLLICILYPGHGLLGLPISVIIFVPLFVLCLFRRRAQVKKDMRSYPEGTSKPWPWRKLCRLRVFMKCAWHAVDSNHRWYTLLLLAFLDCSWALRVISICIGASEPDGGYVMSYGQVLALFATVPTLLSTLELIYLHRWDLVRFLRRFPRLCLAEGKYLMLGIEPDPPVEGSPIPPNIIPSNDKPTLKPTLNTLRDQTIACLLAHPRPLLPELGPVARRRIADGNEDSGSCTRNSIAASRDSVCDEV